jgi:contact-dependent growth inhibition (CDI) system CdiI-like immunity protein
VFAIELQSQQEAGEMEGSSAEASGRIVIGEFTETFNVPLGFWGESDYHRSWLQAFEVLNANSHATSCLMTSMTDPGNSNFLICWPMYREGEDVYIQNAIIFLDEIAGAFDPTAPWRYVSPRQRIDEDGNKISEWTTSMESLREFFG